MTPKIGDIVLYSPAPDTVEADADKTGLPAIIVRVWPNGRLNLKVFTNTHTDTWRVDVRYSDTREGNTWRYRN